MKQSNKRWNNGRRLCLVLALSAFTLVPGLAGAYVVEFQVQGSNISQLIGDSLVAEGFCPVELDLGGIGVGVDQIETSASGFEARRNRELSQTVNINPELRLTGPTPQLVIPLTVHLKSPVCMNEPECDDHFMSMGLNAFVSLSMNGDELCGEFAGFDLEEAADAEDEIRDNIGSQCMSIDLSMIASMLGDAVVIGSAVSVSDEGILAVRIEYGSELPDGSPDYASADERAWNDFLSGDLSPNDHPEDGWSLFIDQHLITQAMMARIETQLSDVDDFTLTTGSSNASWTAREDQARMDINSYGEADLCSIDITVRTGIDMFLGDDSYLPEGVLPADALMVSEGGITIDKDRGETLGCAALLSLAGMGLYPEFFSVWGIISGIIRSVEPSLPAMDEESMCVNVGETGFRCITPIRFPRFGLSDDPSQPYADMSVDRLYGHAQGLILSGAFLLHEAPPPQRISGTYIPFALDTGDRCCNQRVALRGRLNVSGSGEICGDPERVSEDPLHVYSVNQVSSGGMGRYQIGLHAGPDSEFWSAPYDLEFRVKSTVGMMLFHINAPVEPSAGEFDDAYSECSEKHLNCLLDEMTMRDGPEFDLPPDESYASIKIIDEKEVETSKDVSKVTETESKVVVSQETVAKTSPATVSTSMVATVSTTSTTSGTKETSSSTGTTKVPTDDAVAMERTSDTASATATSSASITTSATTTAKTAAK